jgi:hypothetical protein
MSSTFLSRDTFAPVSLPRRLPRTIADADRLRVSYLLWAVSGFYCPQKCPFFIAEEMFFGNIPHAGALTHFTPNQAISQPVKPRGFARIFTPHFVHNNEKHARLKCQATSVPCMLLKLNFIRA